MTNHVLLYHLWQTLRSENFKVESLLIFFGNRPGCISLTLAQPWPSTDESDGL